MGSEAMAKRAMILEADTSALCSFFEGGRVMAGMQCCKFLRRELRKAGSPHRRLYFKLGASAYAMRADDKDWERMFTFFSSFENAVFVVDNRHFADDLVKRNLPRMREITRLDILNACADNDCCALRDILIHMSEDHYRLRANRVLNDLVRGIWKLNVFFAGRIIPLPSVLALGRKILYGGASGFKSALPLLVKYEQYIHGETTLASETSCFLKTALSVARSDDDLSSIFQFAYDLLSPVHSCEDYSSLDICKLLLENGTLDAIITAGSKVSCLKNHFCDIVKVVAEHDITTDVLIEKRVHVTLADFANYPHTSEKALDALHIIACRRSAESARTLWEDVGPNLVHTFSRSGARVPEVLGISQIMLSFMKTGGIYLIRRIIREHFFVALHSKLPLLVEDDSDDEKSHYYYIFFDNLTHMCNVDEVANDEIRAKIIRPLVEVAREGSIRESMDALEILYAAAYSRSAMQDFPLLANRLLQTGEMCQINLTLEICHRIVDDYDEDDKPQVVLMHALLTVGIPTLVQSLLDAAGNQLDTPLCRKLMSIFEDSVK